MSLDFYLTQVQTKEVEVFDANITHNLTQMADKAGIYDALWWPDEHGYTKAGQIVPILREGLAKLEADPEYFETFDSPNGFGRYVHFVPWVRKVLEACEEYPDADIRVSR